MGQTGNLLRPAGGERDTGDRRDILAEAMARMEGYGLNIVGHVHDEVIIEAPKDQYTVDEVCKLMSVNPEWCKDLPLNAAGYKGSYYFKD